MNIIVLTPVRLLGDGLALCFYGRPEVHSVSLVNDVAGLRAGMGTSSPDIVLIDVSQGVELFDVREIAVEWPHIPLVALGLVEQGREVIKCGRAGFAGYVAREASIDGLCRALSDISEGRLACPPEISGGLLRALFRKGPQSEESLSDPELTRREKEVLAMLGQGLSNKEIGGRLSLSVATVKHHVHGVLEKLGLSKRGDVLRRVSDTPLMSRAATAGIKRAG